MAWHMSWREGLITLTCLMLLALSAENFLLTADQLRFNGYPIKEGGDQPPEGFITLGGGETPLKESQSPPLFSIDCEMVGGPTHT